MIFAENENVQKFPRSLYLFHISLAFSEWSHAEQSGSSYGR